MSIRARTAVVATLASAVIAAVAVAIVLLANKTDTSRAVDLEGAIRSGDPDAVRAAIASGADVNTPIVDSEWSREILWGSEPIEVPPLVIAAETSRAIVKLLLDAGANVNATEGPIRTTALMAAAESNRPDIVRLLLEQGADVDAIWGGTVPHTALSFAGRAGYIEVVWDLLNAGADPLLGHWHPDPALRSAEGSRTNHIVPKALKAWVSIRVRNEDPRERGWTDLMLAARDGDAALLRNLIERGSAVDAQDEDGWSALMWASAPVFGSEEKVQALLEAGADPNLSTRWGWTALMCAAYSGDARRIRLLVDAGADVNARETTGQDTVLNVAALRGSAAAVQALLDAGADVTAENDATMTALFRAEYNRTPDREAIKSILQEAWESASWPERAEEIELVPAGEEGATQGELWPGETFWRDVDGGMEASGNIWVNNPTVDLAFEIYWVVAGVEYRVGSLAVRHGAVRSFEYSARLKIDPPRQVDIVLRPNREVALRELSTRRIWGEEVWMRGIRVDL